ncbi:hypothetical protein EU538_08915 [Candidatus Thorarchaeota archaeon]|nr:MAG: hypothetical protein EU538_08915 [Candidatus Thorarchaeota archaeon]
MPRSLRGVPGEIAAFGERQFRETGAVAVEVLRVKASTMRKHFRRLQGITYLVAVINLDRIRVYFFNREGVMLVGENVEESTYRKIRGKSRLLAKFEKPREPTEEELRMEATEELRNALSRAIKRVSRFLAVTEPSFPEMYVSKESIAERKQSFGLKTEDDALIFQESFLHGAALDGLANRAAFLLLLEGMTHDAEYINCLGNAVSAAVLKSPLQEDWESIWLKNSKETDYHPLMRHFRRHLATYQEDGFYRLLEVAKSAPLSSDLSSWLGGLEVIHDSLELSAGTEEYPVFKRFLEGLANLNTLKKKQNTLERFHLAPRAWCNPKPLGRELHVIFGPDASPEYGLGQILYFDNHALNSMSVLPEGGAPVNAIEYMLNLEDIFPKPGGLVSRGKYLIQRALVSMGLRQLVGLTFSQKLDFSGGTISTVEKAVLERLWTGSLRVLSDSLIGSPKRIQSLIDSGHLSLVPDFNHLGLSPTHLLRGTSDHVLSICKESALEATILHSESESYAVVCSVSHWRKELINSCAEFEVDMYPVGKVNSKGWLFRGESVLFDLEECMTWGGCPSQ